MPSLYDAALTLVRVFGMTNVVLGIGAFIGIIFAGMAATKIGGEGGQALFGVIAYLSEFGICGLLGGILILLFSKKIARFASKG